MKGPTGLVLILCVNLVMGRSDEHDNFCKPLEDWGPLTYTTEERTLCRSVIEKDCQPLTERLCLEITDINCQVSQISKSSFSIYSLVV